MSYDRCDLPRPVARSRWRTANALAAHIRDGDRRAGRLDPLRALHGARAVRAGPGLLHRRRAQARGRGRFRHRARDLAAVRPHARRARRRRCSRPVGGEILEIGAGTRRACGRHCSTSWSASGACRALPHPRAQPGAARAQRDTLAARVPHLLERVAWLNRLPPRITGVVVGNEVLDAMPVHIVRTRGDAIDEAGVVVAHGAAPFDWAHASRRRRGRAQSAAGAGAARRPTTTEIGLVARALRASRRDHARTRHRAVHRLRLPARRVLPSAAARRAR